MAHRAPEQSNSVTDVIAWLTPDRRRKLYVVLTLIAPLLVGYGVIEEQQAALWLSLASAILVGGIAALHTPKAAPLATPTTVYNVSVNSPEGVNQAIQRGIDNAHGRNLRE